MNAVTSKNIEFIPTKLLVIFRRVYFLMVRCLIGNALLILLARLKSNPALSLGFEIRLLYFCALALLIIAAKASFETLVQISLFLRAEFTIIMSDNKSSDWDYRL